MLHQFEVVQRGHGGAIIVKPDGFIRVRENEADGGLSEHTFFLEVDRSTETLNTLVMKAVAYREYYRSGGLAVRFGASKEAFNEYPFRVLMVLKSESRQNNHIQSLLKLNPPILKQCWTTTLREITANPLGEIWKKPEDSGEKRNNLL